MAKAEYKIMEYLRHAEQAEAEAVEWHKVMGHFQTERERQAFAAGFRDGIGKARSIMTLHGVPAPNVLESGNPARAYK